MQRSVRLGLSCLLALLFVGSAPTAEARRRKKSVAIADPDYASAPAYKYANMARSDCMAALVKRKIHHVVVDEARGVDAPVRIPKGVNGVRFHTLLPPKKAKTSPWEVFDCRLVLALYDFADVLRAHDIDEVLIFSAWRPNRRHPKGKQAKRHPGALAVDIFKLGKKLPATKAGDKPPKRIWLDVKKDWHGRIGAKTCGKKAAKPRKKSPKASELRKIICESANKRQFTSMLTPNYDRAHHNHFHFDLTPEVKWRIVR